MAVLQQHGDVRVEPGLGNEKEALKSYTLVQDEETIRSNYFRPQQKINHHVGLLLDFYIRKAA